jgi:hypothetical protein
VAIPVPFNFASTPPAATLANLEGLAPGLLFGAGQLDGPDIGFFPFNTVIPLGGGIVGSRPILAAGLNAFLWNVQSTNGMVQGFISPCDPRDSSQIMALGDLTTNGLRLFDEAAAIPPPFEFGAGATPVAGPAVGLVWHTFILLLFNPDPINDALLQFCELYANTRTSV